MNKQTIRVCSALLVLALFAGCSSKSDSGMTSASTAQSYEVAPEAGYYEEAADEEVAYDDSTPAEVMPNPATGGSDGFSDAIIIGGEASGREQSAQVMPEEPEVSPDIPTEERKIVYSVDLSLQTTDFDAGVAGLPELVQSFGGHVQDSYVEGTNMHDKYYSRGASFTARIPSDKLDAFLGSLGEGYHVVYQHKSSSDISGQYYDTAARLNSLRVQEERLTAMLESATELEYLLQVERELADVLYQIETMTSALNRMDSSVNLSTVTIHLQEVSAYEDGEPVSKPVTFGERVGETIGDSWRGFIDFCQGFVLFLIALVPFLPLIAVIVVIVWLVVRRRRKRRARTQPSTQPQIYPVVPADAPEQPEGDTPSEE